VGSGLGKLGFEIRHLVNGVGLIGLIRSLYSTVSSVSLSHFSSSLPSSHQRNREDSLDARNERGLLVVYIIQTL
jgi:hypothetical protein